VFPCRALGRNQGLADQASQNSGLNRPDKGLVLINQDLLDRRRSADQHSRDCSEAKGHEVAVNAGAARNERERVSTQLGQVAEEKMAPGAAEQRLRLYSTHSRAPQAANPHLKLPVVAGESVGGPHQACQRDDLPYSAGSSEGAPQHDEQAEACEFGAFAPLIQWTVRGTYPLSNIGVVPVLATARQKQRPYASELRSKQQELTRDRIMEAVADLLRQGRIHNFTVQDVARGAGVAYGSVYRHFPTREALLEELYEWLEQGAFKERPPFPDSMEGLAEWAAGFARMSEEHPDLTHAGTIAMTALRLVPRSQRGRDDALRELIARSAPHLSSREVRERAAIIRYLATSLAWVTLRNRCGLNGDEVVSAMTWALNALSRDIKQAGPGRPRVDGRTRHDPARVEPRTGGDKSTDRS
jgi:AcrR family transcriptional regulator